MNQMNPSKIDATAQSPKSENGTSQEDRVRKILRAHAAYTFEVERLIQEQYAEIEALKTNCKRIQGANVDFKKELDKRLLNENTATNGIAFTIDCKQFCIRLVDGQWQMARGGQGTPFTNIEENHHVRTPLPPGTLVKDHERNIVGMIQEATENAPVTHAMAHVELGHGVPSPEKSFGQVAFEQWFKTDSSERWSICTEERKKRFNEEAQAVIDEFLRRNHVVPQSQYDAVQADLTKQWKDNEQLRKDYDHTVKREAGIIEQRNQLAVQLTESKHTAVGYLNELRHNRLTNGEELKAYDELKTTHASLQHKYDHLKESAVDAVQAFGVLEFEANATTGIVVASGWLSHANKQIAKLRKEVTS
jgi:hypothetical protein